MPQIETAQVADLATVGKWCVSEEQVRNWAGSRVSFPIESTKLPEQIEWRDAFSFRLVSGEVLAGFGQIIPKPGDRLHLARIIVGPRYRGEGYGRKLTQALVDEAISRRPKAISLNVFATNVAAFQLYKSLGFSQASREPGDAPSKAQYMVYENLTGRCS
ncbi:GNAT family N-acetyltransferase [Chromohalobacter sarecensis]|uniref:GNAT family N-acetyltransferase n=1 Tax=Chromohalobacter sarecensis TaxID=245294 RepID=A0ABV9D129_9GAMM|nr:GNAT family N-acetyltransferase [Chromohalobacter sarecensis]